MIRNPSPGSPLRRDAAVHSANPPTIPATNAPAAGPVQERFWTRRTLRTRGCAALLASLAVVALAPRPAHGQLGLDLAPVLLALQQLQSLMQQYIAAPLALINQAEQSLNSYTHQVVYPPQAINQARNTVTQVEGAFHQIAGLSNLRISSATLPQPQALESMLLSRNASNVVGLGTQFQNVYGPVMAEGTASPQARMMADITDAQAQDAMKRALEIDALSDAELAQADRLGEQIAEAAPGSAPILEAEADAWLIRANAYTMSALAELTRTRSIDIANQSEKLKIGAGQTNTLNGYVGSTLNTAH